jgi:hypothetical protein
VRLGICGGRALLKQFLTFLRKHGIGLNTNVRAQGKIYRFDLTCGTALKAIRLLYEHVAPEVVLERKLLHAKRVMERW